METSAIRRELRVADYLAFVGLLVTSTGIGLYFAFRDRNKNSTKNYFFGGKKMNPIAVGLSLAVTFQSSVAVLANPAEAYISGSLVLWDVVMNAVVIPIALFYFIPVFHRLQLNTIYEYLELRFCAALRRLAAGMMSLGTIFYIGTIVYLPAAALNAITPLPLAWSILLTGTICTLYTTLGGMKGVIWTDVFQSIIMMAGIFAVCLRGMHVVGGLDDLLGAMDRGDRFTLQRFDFGVVSRLSPTALIMGGFASRIDSLCFSQSIVQRYQSCRSARHAQYALLVYALPTILIVFTTYANGFVMYAFFEGCDPVKAGTLQSIDQGIAYVALEIFQFIPGLAGLFISAIFSATLSTVSSCLNSLSVIILQDFVVAKRPSLSERNKVLTGKIIVVIVGFVSVAMAFLISSSESSGLELLYGFFGLIYGPLSGIYILGFFIPWANKIGAICGILSGYAVLTFMFVGKNFFNHPPYRSNVPGVLIGECAFNGSANATEELFEISETSTGIFPTGANLDSDNRTFLRDIYNINFNLFNFIGLVTALVIGIASSFISGHTPASKADPNLFIPLIDSKIFPKSIRRFFRLGVRNITDMSIPKDNARANSRENFEMDAFI